MGNYFGGRGGVCFSFSSFPSSTFSHNKPVSYFPFYFIFYFLLFFIIIFFQAQIPVADEDKTGVADHHDLVWLGMAYFY